MTLRLVLTRHAKSSWDDLTLSDFERVLNKRGQGAAKAIGAWISAQGYTPDAALCSAATRTRETLERSGLQPETQFLDGLYHAGADKILSIAQGKGSGKTLMIVAHNPGIAEFAGRILQRTPQHPRFADYPSGATLVADFEAERWADLRFGAGTPLAFIVPRELTE
ncbi:histidine phosphatase family protein [Lentibacter algarum]|uniref:SixA phosphatase family protein n=1 Tax=Lentibacter algarum TaxID=576131 RepID=UPI001C07ED64|nr:histidine phosphatase family protein [Lentibacter algarum]MBU2981957.1 histidine phosphatase family protein [Lentibacter algarum]